MRPKRDSLSDVAGMHEPTDTRQPRRFATAQEIAAAFGGTPKKTPGGGWRVDFIPRKPAPGPATTNAPPRPRPRSRGAGRPRARAATTTPARGSPDSDPDLADEASAALGDVRWSPTLPPQAYGRLLHLLFAPVYHGEAE